MIRPLAHPIHNRLSRKNGEDGYSVKLNSIPVGNWDGALILLPPFADETEQGQEPND